MLRAELRTGIFTDIFTALTARADLVVTTGLHLAAEEVVHEAVTSFVGRHAYGTPSPARQGGPPSRVSTSLEKAVHATPVEPVPAGWRVRVGPRPGIYPTYGRGHADSATYGRYMELGLSGRRHASYPWLKPAFERATRLDHLYALFRRTPLL